MNLRLIKLLAKLASRGAGSASKSGKQGGRPPITRDVFSRPDTPYEKMLNVGKGKRQAAYDKQGKIGKALWRLSERNIKKNKYDQPSTELRVSPFIADLIRNKLKESDNRTFEGDDSPWFSAEHGLPFLDKNHRLHQAPHYAETNNQHNFKDNEKLIQFLKGLSSEERASWEEEALTKQPKLFDAISGASQ